jgi:hypothetical protein
MLNAVGSNYRQSVIGNADSVRLNAYASNNSKAYKQRNDGIDSVLLRCQCCCIVRKQFKNGGFVAANVRVKIAR